VQLFNIDVFLELLYPKVKLDKLFVFIMLFGRVDPLSLQGAELNLHYLIFLQTL
jgi:hypothetical protein